jgi:hypothetical protein
LLPYFSQTLNLASVSKDSVAACISSNVGRNCRFLRLGIPGSQYEYRSSNKAPEWERLRTTLPLVAAGMPNLSAITFTSKGASALNLMVRALAGNALPVQPGGLSARRRSTWLDSDDDGESDLGLDTRTDWVHPDKEEEEGYSEPLTFDTTTFLVHGGVQSLVDLAERVSSWSFHRLVRSDIVVGILRLSPSSIRNVKLKATPQADPLVQALVACSNLLSLTLDSPNNPSDSVWSTAAQPPFFDSTWLSSATSLPLSLRSLTLNTVDLDQSLFDFLSSLPHLTSLSIDKPRLGPDRELPRLATPVSLPSLSTLSVSSGGARLIVALVSMFRLPQLLSLRLILSDRASNTVTDEAFNRLATLVLSFSPTFRTIVVEHRTPSAVGAVPTRLLAALKTALAVIPQPIDTSVIARPEERSIYRDSDSPQLSPVGSDSDSEFSEDPLENSSGVSKSVSKDLAEVKRRALWLLEKVSESEAMEDLTAGRRLLKTLKQVGHLEKALKD